mmetsp:Transcript_60052/g.178057  ORF Transcript_60052/g.178057 Transcript_60052/m.178057 type:complete len:258 (-) Transcript_60052:1039-1812(-)
MASFWSFVRVRSFSLSLPLSSTLALSFLSSSPVSSDICSKLVWMTSASFAKADFSSTNALFLLSHSVRSLSKLSWDDRSFISCARKLSVWALCNSTTFCSRASLSVMRTVRAHSNSVLCWESVDSASMSFSSRSSLAPWGAVNSAMRESSSSLSSSHSSFLSLSPSLAAFSASSFVCSSWLLDCITSKSARASSTSFFNISCSSSISSLSLAQVNLFSPKRWRSFSHEDLSASFSSISRATIPFWCSSNPVSVSTAC